jgi:hypothetical protein
MKISVLVQPAAMIAPRPAFATAAPAYPPNSACDELVGRPQYHVKRSQRIAPVSPAKFHAERHDRGVDHAGADGLRDRGAERERGDEVEEGGPRHRVARREDARRDDGRDRVRGVVEAVDEVEDQRHGDQHDHRDESGIHRRA